MKKYLLLLISLFSVCTIGQAQESDQQLYGQRVWRVPRIPTVNNQITYAQSRSLPGFYKEELFTNAYYWLKNNLKSDDIEMRVADKTAGHIAGRGKITYNQGVVDNNAAQAIYFDYDLTLHDGGYTYTLNNFRGVGPRISFDYSVMYQEELNKVEAAGIWDHKYRYELLSDLNSFMNLFTQGLEKNIVGDQQRTTKK